MSMKAIGRDIVRESSYKGPGDDGDDGEPEASGPGRG